MNRRIILFSFCGLIALCGVALFILPSLGFAHLNAELQEIDINSGKARFTRFVFYMRVSQVEKETVVSRLISGPTQARTEWHSVNLFTAGSRISPHYCFHGALSQLNRLELALQNSNMTEEDMQLYARRIVKAWKAEGDYFAAGAVIEEAEDRAYKKYLRTDQSTESRAFGTSGISAAKQPRMLEAGEMR
jgi:hypothetical protein